MIDQIVADRVLQFSLLVQNRYTVMLLVDCLHWCQANKEDFDDLVKIAKKLAAQETNPTLHIFSKS